MIECHRDILEVVGLSAHFDEHGLRALAMRFPEAKLCLSGSDSTVTDIDLVGPSGLDEFITDTEADLVMNGAAGSGGLRPSLAALASGKNLALANKESVVMAWPLLAELSRSRGGKILPVDSEHAALFQLIATIGEAEIDELIITASGGAFRDRDLPELVQMSPDEAASHPNWNMGRKITIDSATMANKGLEVIEASRFFGIESQRIRVLIHPQSLVHSLVRTRDGSLYAQISAPDMRLPIQNALTWPACIPCPFGRLDLAGCTLEFREPQRDRYPLLGLAYDALAAGEGATIAYNAADEVAVAAFEACHIGYTDIAKVVERTLESGWPSRARELKSIFEIDGHAREAAAGVVREIEC